MIEYEIIDSHCHIFPDKIAEKAVESIGTYYGIPMYASGTAEDLIKNGSRIGVKKYVVHSTATKVEQVQAINDFIAGTLSSYSCFIGFGTLHPDLEEPSKEVDRVIDLGLKGIKLHPDFQDFDIDDDRMSAIYKAIEGRLPVLIHMGDENRKSSRPLKLRRVIERFPGLKVIAAHLGGYTMWQESMECLVGTDIYMDTTSSLYFLGREKTENIIKKHGADKILFGTDYPMWSHEEELERFLKLQLAEEERQMILCNNAKKLFKVS